MSYNGFFGGLFDLNHDGKLDMSEQALDFAAFMDLVVDGEEKDGSGNDNGSDNGNGFDNDDDE